MGVSFARFRNTAMRYLPRLLGKQAVGLARWRWLKCPAHNLRNHAGLEVQMKTLGAPVPLGWLACRLATNPGRGRVQHGLRMIPRAHLSRRDVLSSPPRPVPIGQAALRPADRSQLYANHRRCRDQHHSSEADNNTSRVKSLSSSHAQIAIRLLHLRGVSTTLLSGS